MSVLVFYIYGWLISPLALAKYITNSFIDMPKSSYAMLWSLSQRTCQSFKSRDTQEGNWGGGGAANIEILLYVAVLVHDE